MSRIKNVDEGDYKAVESGEKRKRRGGAGDEELGDDAAASNSASPMVTMESILDYLTLLNYMEDFCRAKRFKPLTRHFFALPSANPNDQFYAFTNITAWLMSLLGRKFEPPQQYDDPNATATNVMMELKAMGINTDFSLGKLKQGWGEAVCDTLLILCERCFEKAKILCKKPIHRDDDYREEEAADADAEVTTAQVEEEEEEPSDEEDMFLGGKAMPMDTLSKPDNILMTTTDAAEWKLEVERVIPQLKVVIHNDNKDWRTHFGQMKAHNNTIEGSLNETKTQLDRLHSEIGRTLEKISSREKYINTQLEQQITEYRSSQDQLSEITDKYKGASGNVTSLTNDLARVSEELETVKSEMDKRGSSMTDQQPLVKIKQALNRLKTESTQMDLRLGVVQYTLLNCRIRNKSAIQRDMNAPSTSSDFNSLKAV